MVSITNVCTLLLIKMIKGYLPSQSPSDFNCGLAPDEGLGS